MAFPQDAPSGQDDPIGSVVSGLTGDSSGGAGLLALLDGDPENTDVIQQLVGESGSADSLIAKLDDVVDELTGIQGATVTDLVYNVDDLINGLVELPSLSGASSDGSGGLLDDLLSGLNNAASSGSLESILGGLSN